METLVIPFTAATVFTLGGYGIMQAKRHAEVITFVLGTILLTCALLILTLAMAHLTNRSCAPGSEMCLTFWEVQAQAMMAP